MNISVNNLLIKRKAAAIISAVILVSAVVLIISLSIGLSSIGENQIRLYQNQSGGVFFNIDGCAEEALTRLNKNSFYTGETLNMQGTSCLINVSGTGNVRIISISATKNDYRKNLRIDVEIFPVFTVTTWKELTI
jgi:hypothetical protein